MTDNNTLEVKILEKEFLVACPPDKRTSLLNAAHHLDGKMREIRASGKVHGTERIAVMAALNITYELLQKNSHQQGDQKILDDLEAKLNQALNHS